jgi:hypothetical protein
MGTINTDIKNEVYSRALRDMRGFLNEIDEERENQAIKFLNTAVIKSNTTTAKDSVTIKKEYVIVLAKIKQLLKNIQMVQTVFDKFKYEKNVQIELVLAHRHLIIIYQETKNIETQLSDILYGVI